MRLRGRHYRTERMIEVLIEGGVIVQVGTPAPGPADLEATWIAPAFFDLQFNGAGGISFNSATLTVEQIRQVTQRCHEHGIGALLPTLVTGGFEALAHGFRTLARARAEDAWLGRALAGFHLEGPYISPVDGPRGAHPKAHVRLPDWDEFRRFQDAAEGAIRLLTLAPELDGAIPFIEKLVASGVVVALGHTAAPREAIRAAIEAGARLSTHLGNGSHAVLPRHDNYIWEQMAADELWASLICDGHHLPATVVKCIARVKTPERLILTCDAGTLAGMPPGRYREWDQDFEILPEGKIVVAGTGFLAGSWVFTDACVARMIEFTGLPLAGAIDLAGAQPRRLLGLPERTLGVGQPADVMLFDWQAQGPMQVRHTIVGDRCFAGYP